MYVTQNFKFIKEAADSYARKNVFNAFADQVDAALAVLRSETPTPVLLRNMVSDADQAAAPPVGAVNGDGFLVNNWGVGNYVGTYVGPFADGDFAEYNDALGGFVRVLANAAGAPVLGIRVIVKAAGSAGSFALQGDNIGLYNGLWSFTVPTDGKPALVIGNQTVWENETFVYDLAVGAWFSQGKTSIRLSGVWLADVGLGDDTTGSGSFERPFRTIGAAQALAAPGDTILLAPGIYPETIVIDDDLNIQELIPGTVIIQDTVLAGAVVSIIPAAAGANVRINASVENLSGTGPGDIGLLVRNAAGVGPAEVRFGGKMLSGQAAGMALNVEGDLGAAMRTAFYADAVEDLVGGTLFDLHTATDIVLINGTQFAGGLAAWMGVTGTAGRVVLKDSYLQDALAGETLNYGGGAACGVGLILAGTFLAGTLDMDNLGGAGQVDFALGAMVNRIIASQADQRVFTFLSENEVKAVLYNVDLNPAVPPVLHTIFAPGAGRVFAPHTARPINEGPATGALLSYQVNGDTGAGSVVAPVGPGALGTGIRTDAVLQDIVTQGFSTLDLEILTASGAADVANYEVIGRVL